MTLTYKAMSLTATKDQEEKIVSASILKSNGDHVALQNPLFLREFDVDTQLGMIWVGYQFIWISESETPYQVYLTRDMLEKKEPFQVPFYAIHKIGADNFTDPAGMMTCRILK
ncbi:hypothetical protein D3C87_1738000 [compost metagenome]